MLVEPNRKGELSDAQFDTLTGVAARGSDVAVRFADTRTVMTLTAMAKRGYVTLQYGPVDGRPRGITSAVVTGAGAKVLGREVQRRADVAAYDAAMTAAIAGTAARVDHDDAPVLDIITGPAGTPAVVVASRSVTGRMDPFDVIRTGARREVEIPF